MKERIIGAAVLVLFVVLVVPVFLDGRPGNDEMVSERVPLPGQSEQKSQTVVLERDRKDPVPSNGGAATARPTPQPNPDQQTPSPRPKKTSSTAQPVAQATPQQAPEKQAPAQDKPAPQPRIATSSSTGMWAVQLGSFSSQENAEKLAADLRKQGFAAFLSQLATDSGQLHRVRIGPQKDRESAEAMASRLQKAGHRGQVVPHP